MKKLAYLIPVVAVALIAAGCNKSNNNPASSNTTQSNTAQNTTENTQNSSESSNHAHDEGHGSKLAGTRIDLQNSNNLKPGEVTLAFKMFGLDAHEFGPDDLNIAHEKLMHLIVVRDDATGFQHVHPEYQNGRWTVKTNIPQQGAYNMYVDVSPKEEAETILRVPLTIGGKTAQAQFPAISQNMTVTQDGMQVKLSVNSSFKTKEHSKLQFMLTRNGQPVAQIEPYLGAFGHVVVLRHGDPDDYLHAHPVTETKPTNGQVEFESEFPSKGTYTIYAQFQVSGKVMTFPITLSVNEEGQAPADHATDAHTGDSH